MEDTREGSYSKEIVGEKFSVKNGHKSSWQFTISNSHDLLGQQKGAREVEADMACDMADI